MYVILRGECGDGVGRREGKGGDGRNSTVHDIHTHTHARVKIDQKPDRCSLFLRFALLSSHFLCLSLPLAQTLCEGLTWEAKEWGRNK